MNKSDRNWLNAVGPGWASIVQPLINKANEEGVTIIQVKEKFGGLRFYTGTCSQEFSNMVIEAENASYTICEECGEPGEPDNYQWIKTLCPKHKEERQAKWAAEKLKWMK